MAEKASYPSQGRIGRDCTLSTAHLSTSHDVSSSKIPVTESKVVVGARSLILTCSLPVSLAGLRLE